MRAAKDFHTQFLDSTKEKMAKLETTIHSKCQKLSKDHIEVEFIGWIPNPGYSKT
jgi:hypothetical protein